MRLSMSAPLFAWGEMADSPDLRAVRDILDHAPLAELIRALEQLRGRGRNDFPVRVLLRTVIAAAILRHQTYEAMLSEMRRNDGLCRVIGLEPTCRNVPTPWALSRFLKNLGRPELLELVHRAFNGVVSDLTAAVPNLGARLAGDSTHLNARPEKKLPTAADPDAQLPAPEPGEKEYRDADGRVTQTLKWNGYKLHMLVDTEHELPLAYSFTSANAPDNKEIEPLLDDLRDVVPEGRVRSLAYDKAADDGAIHEALRERGIKPVIEIRALPGGREQEEIVPNRQGLRQFVYTHDGTVYCYDTVSDPPVRRPMKFHGYDSANDTLKYRCPAVADGFACASREKCSGCSAFGKTIRLSPKLDPRRFPEVPRATKKFERLYNERTSVERVNARLKVFWGVEDNGLAGRGRFLARAGVALLVCVTVARLLAMTPRRDGSTSSSLAQQRLHPVAQRLHEARVARARKATPATASPPLSP